MWLTYFHKTGNGLIVSFLVERWWFVSLKTVSTKMILMTAKRSPNPKIECTDPDSMRREPSIGQTTNPSPNIAPRSQKFFFLSFSSRAISVRIACKIDILPPVMPFTILARKYARGALINKITQERELPKIDATRGRFLP